MSLRESLANTLRLVADALGPVPAAAGRMPALEFDPKTLPWIDRDDADITGYVQALRSQGKLPTAYDLQDKLRHWREHGFVVFERAAPSELIDAYLEDLAELWSRAKELSTLVTHEEKGTVPIRQLSPEDLQHPRYRLCDFHNSSVAGKLLALHPTIVSFLGHVFLDRVVAMQSLTFLKGSGQRVHQDFPYVVSRIPSHLAASWTALEDVHPDAGPLAYYPGSHRKVRKFDFGNGMFLNPQSSLTDHHFAAHLETECRLLGIELQHFAPKKGDIFIWHGALAHRGSVVNNPNLTRKSYVVHFSSRSAYPRDIRTPGTPPDVYERNGGWLYRNPLAPAEEDTFPRGAAL